MKHRVRRAPAVWGAPAPDYHSSVYLGDGDRRYLHTILFVDSKIVRQNFFPATSFLGLFQMEHYDNDFLRAKQRVLQVVEEANRVGSPLVLAFRI